jgi:hypothetical protein
MPEMPQPARMQLPSGQSLELNLNGVWPAGRTLAVTFTGAPVQTWVAASDKPWLVLTTAAGSGSGVIVFSVDTSTLATLENFSADTAHITVTPSGLASAAVAVTLTKNIPEIFSVSPATLLAEAASTLRIRGRGLRQLQNVSALRVVPTHAFPGPGVANVTGTIVSDAEIQLSLPALGSGNYGVTFTAFGDTPAATHQIFSVGPAPVFASAILATPPGKRGMIMYRDALFVVETDSWTLERYFITTFGLVHNRSLALVPGSSVGMSLNGQILYTTAGTTGIEERRPDTLALIAAYPGTVPLNNGILQVTDDNRIWFNDTLTYFDTVKKRFATTSDNVVTGRHYAAANGARMFTVPEGSLSDTIFARYEPDTGHFEQIDKHVMLGPRNVALSGDGKWVVSYRHVVYNALNIQPAGDGYTDNSEERQFLSRDGSRLYIAESGLIPLRLARIHVYDAHTATRLGEITVPAGVSTCDVQCNYSGNLALSPFDNAFFWAGHLGIAVIPIPVLLQPQQAALRPD